jgi:hypothetical protein
LLRHVCSDTNAHYGRRSHHAGQCQQALLGHPNTGIGNQPEKRDSKGCGSTDKGQDEIGHEWRPFIHWIHQVGWTVGIRPVIRQKSINLAPILPRMKKRAMRAGYAVCWSIFSSTRACISTMSSRNSSARAPTSGYTGPANTALGIRLHLVEASGDGQQCGALIDGHKLLASPHRQPQHHGNQRCGD